MAKRAVQASSIKDVATLAGVSIATVSRVVNGVANKASSETVERVRKAIATLDYRPTSAGRDLRQGTSRLVAVLAANLANPTMAAVAASAETALRQAGLVMVLCDTHDKPELQDEYLREMQAQRARAIVLLAAVESPMLASMRGGATPLIFVNRRDPCGGEASRYVGIDNMSAGKEVAENCIGAGLTAAALIHGWLASSATSDRVSGFLTAFSDAGYRLPADMVIAPTAQEHLQIGHTGAMNLIERGSRVDVVVCTSDLIAFGAHRAFRESGVRHPRFIGFDDSPMNDWVAPWLTSVRIPYGEFGSALVAMLADEAAKRSMSERIKPHRLVVRIPMVEQKLPAEAMTDDAMLSDVRSKDG